MKCSACGDHGKFKYQGQTYCKECYEELTEGKISSFDQCDPNLHFFGGRAGPHEGHGNRDEEMSPLQELAYKNLEEEHGNC